MVFLCKYFVLMAHKIILPQLSTSMGVDGHSSLLVRLNVMTTEMIIVMVKIVVVCMFVGCLMSQQHASVPQGRICSDNSTCCHTEIEVTDLTFYLTQSQYTDTGPTSPSADPRPPGAWQGSHWSANF